MSFYGSQHGEVAAFIESIPSLTAGDWLVPGAAHELGQFIQRAGG